MNNLRIAIIPLDIVWTDVAENIFATESLLNRISKNTDIVVLPELFSTGFIATQDLLHKFADDDSNPVVYNKICEWAKKYNFAIAGSYLARQNGEIFNRAFFVEPSGESTFYDKKHLFSLSTESQHFTPGKEPIPTVRFRGWNIALAVCYEVRFPVWLRNQGNRYDLLLIPANWPAARAYAWEHLLIARAIENQAYIVGANRSGSDDSGKYDNLSYIFNYLGKPIHQTDKNLNILTAELELDKLHSYRQYFPVAKDADSFFLQIPPKIF